MRILTNSDFLQLLKNISKELQSIQLKMLVEKTFIGNNKSEINILDQNKSFDCIAVDQIKTSIL